MHNLNKLESSKRERLLIVLNELLETSEQLEHDLNYSGDHYGSEYLIQASKHSRSINYLIKKEIDKQKGGI